MYPSIFSEPWWLDVVAPGRWSAVELKEGDRVYARMPYVLRKKAGLKVVYMPPLTQSLGPWLEPRDAKYARQLAFQKDCMTALIEGLPAFDRFSQSFHYSVTNWLPFYWKGFQQTTRYTYVLDEIGDRDKVWSGFLENIRTDVRKAEKKLTIREDLGVDRLIDLIGMTFRRQGREAMPHPPELIRRIEAAARERDRGRMFFAEDAEGRVHAGILVLFDAQSAYYLLSGGDPELRSSGATSLLVWHAIKAAGARVQKFDFEGSMLEPVERFVRAFGARQTAYFRVTRASRRMAVLDALRALSLHR
jgi:hypothetical protein